MSIHSVALTGKTGFFIGVALCVAVISAPAAVAAIDDTTFISRASGAAGAAGDAGSTDASVSADGRYVAFASDADNLSGDDDNGFTNVFVRDTQAPYTTTLVSRQSGTGAGSLGADALSFNPAISANGRYVAFASDADNLGPSNPAALVNVFVRDTRAPYTTTLVSQSTAGVAGDDIANFPSISADGRFVAFASDANNLVAGIDALSVFVRDMQPGGAGTSAVSLASNGDPADDVSAFPTISATGRFVAFQSFANNLSDAEDEAVRNVFVRDMQPGGTTALVSRQSASAGGAGANLTSSDASISADGRYVAFESEATNLSDDDNNGALGDAFVRDLQANTTTLVSRESGAAGAGGDGASGDATLPGDGPAISDDGRFVAFQSESDNLSTADNDDVSNVFFRDTQAPYTTTLVSRQSGTGAGSLGANGASFLAAISADGRYVVFDSSADNLSAADGNGFTDIFQRDVLGVPPDTDPPETIYAGGPAEGETVPEGSVSFQFVSDEPGSVFEARLTGRPDWQSVTSPFTVTDLTAGNYTFEVRAIDTSGNVDPTPVTVNFSVEEGVGPPPPGGDEDPPELRLSADGKQKLGKAIKLDVSCDEACSVAADGTVKAKGKRKQGKRAKLELKELRTELPASRTVTVKLAGSDKVERKLRRAKKGTATITVTATDAAENSVERKLKVKLR